MIDAFVHLLDSPQKIIVEQAIWGLGNIAGDGPKLRDFVIEAGAVDPIAELCELAQPGTSFLRNASWALSNMCRSKPAPDFNRIKRVIPSLAKVLQENNNTEIIGDVCWAISYITDMGKESHMGVVSCNLLPRII